MGDAMKKHFRFMLPVTLLVWSMCAFAFAPPQFKSGTFNDFNYRGNVAAQNGDFEKAIAYWKKAIPLDRSPSVKCRGEGLRIDIKAAKDTILMIQQGKLQRADAPKWFNNHHIELWMPNACNSN